MTTKNTFSLGLIAALGMLGISINVANGSCPTSCPDDVCWVSAGSSIQYAMSDTDIYRVVAAENPEGSDTWSAEDWANYLGLSITDAMDYDTAHEGTWINVNCNCVYEELSTTADIYGGEVTVTWWDGGGALPDITVAGTYTVYAVLQNPDDPPLVSCSNGNNRNEWYAEGMWQPFVLHVVSGAGDCNTNGIPDDIDIAAGSSADADSNGVPDECQPVYVDASASGAGDGSDWGNAISDLNLALQNARAGDEIWVAQGVYYPGNGSDRNASFELVDGVKIYGGFSGAETTREQRDWETNVTILSGDIGVIDDSTDNVYHVVYSGETVHGAVLDGFTIQDGKANGAGSDGQGGGWYNDGGTVEVSWCKFINNTGDYGGAIYNYRGESRVNTCYIQENEANVSGGGIYADGAGGGLELNSCLIYANRSIDNGGAVYTNDADIRLNNCTVVENRAGVEGDVRVGSIYLGGATGGTTTINSSILWGNDGKPTSPMGGPGEQIIIETGITQVMYSDIQGGFPGTENSSELPGFVDPLAQDFRLSCDSLSVDSGDPGKAGSLQTKDLSGVERFIGVVDCGAYEFVGDICRDDTCTNECYCTNPEINCGDCNDGDPGTWGFCVDENNGSCSGGSVKKCHYRVPLSYVRPDCNDLNDCVPCGDQHCKGRVNCCDINDSLEYCEEKCGVYYTGCPSCGPAVSEYDDKVIDNKGREFFLAFLNNGWRSETIDNDYVDIPSITIVSTVPTTGSRNTTVKVEYPAICPRFSETFELAPGELKTVTLSYEVSSSFKHGYGGYEAGEEEPVNRMPLDNAVHVCADYSVICYMSDRLQGFDRDGAEDLSDIWVKPVDVRSGCSSEASLCLPVDAWGQEYYVVGYSGSTWDGHGLMGDRNQFAIVAAYDRTEIEITSPKALIKQYECGVSEDCCPESSSVPCPCFPPCDSENNQVHTAGSSYTIILDRGEAYMTESAGDEEESDLTGTRIKSLNFPIGVITGQRAARYPADKAAADHTIETAFPVSTWGTEIPVYGLPCYCNGSIFRVLASQENTVIKYDGTELNPNDDDSVTDLQNDVGKKCYEISGVKDGHVFSANKPIMVMQYLPGHETHSDCVSGEAWCGSSMGDPSIAALIPSDQYQTSYTFTTPTLVQRDGDFVEEGKHILVVFVEKGGEDYISLDGVSSSLAFNETADGNYMYAWTDIEQGRHYTSSEINASYPNGVPHGILVAGYNVAESYAYTGGAEFRRLDILDSTSPYCGLCGDSSSEFTLDCLVRDSFTEDVNNNGILDSYEDPDGELLEEDLNSNGQIDDIENTGIFWIELIVDEGDLELEDADCFIQGSESANVKVTGIGAGRVIVTDGVGKVCEIPISRGLITPVIDFLNADCDADGDNCVADECDVIRVTSENSDTEGRWVKSEWDFSGGDSFQRVDAVGMEVEYAWTNVGTPGLCLEDDRRSYTVWLRLTDEYGISSVTSKEISIADMCPQRAEMFGPHRVVQGSTACFSAAAIAACDEISSICWDNGFDNEPDPQFAEPCSDVPDGWEKCFTFTEVGMNWVAFKAIDEDGDAFENSEYPDLSAWLAVEVVPNSNGYSEKSSELQLETRYHTYLPGVDVDGYITHQAVVRLRNTGTTEVRWPVYLVFESLSPDDGINPTRLEGDLLEAGTPVAGIVYPHIEVPNPEQDYSIATGESTEFFLVSWKVQAPADGGGAFAFEMVAYALQEPPEFTALPDEHAIEGRYYRSEVTAVDHEGDTVSYQLADQSTDPAVENNPPAFLSLDSIGGVLMGTPSQAETRGADSVAYPVTLLARDGFADSYARWNFNLIVARENVAPEFTTEFDTVAYAGEDYITTIGVFDADEAYEGNTNENLTLTVETYPVVSVSGAQLNLQPVTGMPGHYEAVLNVPEVDLAQVPELWVVLTVDDDDGIHDDAQSVVKEFPVVVTSCTTPLNIRDIQDQFAQEGLPYSKGVELIDDPDPQIFKYYEIEVNDDGAEGITISDDGHIQWLPGYNAHGTYLVRVLVSTDPYDVYGCFDTEVFQLTVADRNTPPRITSEPVTEAAEGEHYTWRVTAVDDDGPLATARLRFFLQRHPAGMEINPVTGFISWHITQNAAELSEEERTVHLAVIDEHGAFDEREFVINVTAVNVEPDFHVNPSRYAWEGEEYVQNIWAIDEDGDELEYELLVGPDDLLTTGEMVIEEVEGRWQLRWTPAEGTADMGKFLITVSATEKYTPERYGDQLSYEIDVRRPYIQCEGPSLDKSQNVIVGAVRVPDGTYTRSGLHESILFASDPDTLADDLQWSVTAVELKADGSLEAVPENEGPSLHYHVAMEPYSRAVIRWVFYRSHIGKRYFILARVEDDCDDDFVIYSLDVLDGNGPNNPPVIEDDLLTTATVDQDYQHTIRAYDPEGDDITLTLEPGSSGGSTGELPNGLDFAANNGKLTISWRPQADQVGTWWLKVTAADDGDPVLQSHVTFPITVSLYGENKPVTITNCIYDRAVAGELYEEYISISDDDTDDTHVFEFVQSPANAEIDPATGLITWIPTTAQLGTRYFTILVTDSGGSWYEQPCVVNVYPSGSSLDSAAPNIVKPTESRIRCSSTGGLCCENDYLAIDFAFTDYDNPDSWSIGKQGFPSGMELVDIDTNSTDGLYEYEIRWPLAYVENGSYEIGITVTDSDEISDEVEFTLLVSNNGTNRAPTITSTPQLTAAVGQEYTYTVIAEDDDDLANAEFTLYRKGATALFEDVYVEQQLQPDRRLVRWTPSYGQLGVEDFVVRVTDAEGAVAERKFAVTVSRDGDNHAPRISSYPVTRASIHYDYEYPVLVADVDPGEKFTWSVWSETAIGLAFDTQEPNILKWAAEDMVVGAHEVTVRVTDSQFSSAEQAFVITVSADGTNDPPVINSVPASTYTPDAAYAGSVHAIDYENNPLSAAAYTVASDADLYFDQTNAGLLLSDGNIIGSDTYDVTVTVADLDGAMATRSWQLWPDTITEAAPWIITNPVRRVVGGAEYLYPLENLPVPGSAYELLGSAGVDYPADLSLVSGNTISWSTAEDDIREEPYLAKVKLVDDYGRSITQQLEIYVDDNLPPEFRSLAPGWAVAGRQYVYIPEAVDPEGTTVDITITDSSSDDAPDFNASTGEFLWTPSTNGVYTFTIEAADQQGRAAEQTFTVNAVDSDQGDFAYPNVEVDVPCRPCPPDEDVNVEITKVFDDGALASVVVTVTDRHGTPLAGHYQVEVIGDIDATNSCLYEVSNSLLTPGEVYLVEVTATDSVEQATTARTDFTIRSDVTYQAPVACILDPIGNEPVGASDEFQQVLISDVTDIKGYAHDPDGDLAKYELQYRPVNDDPSEPFTVFYTGYEDVEEDIDNPNTLGQLDSSMLENGLYEVRVVAFDAFYNQSEAYSFFYSVVGNKKIGNLSMSFVDLEVPVQGIPITIARTYDSRNKSKGDFGYGWRLAFSSLTLQETMPMGMYWPSLEDLESGCSIYGVQGHSVMITWPGGHTEVFEFRPSAVASGLSTDSCSEVRVDSWDFDNTSGGTSKLRLADSYPDYWKPYEKELVDVAGDVWQSRAYILETADGTQYRFEKNADVYDSRTARLTTINDANGNWIEFQKEAVIHHPSNRKISMKRDGENRIYKVIDFEGNEILYNYDQNGDLIKVTDRENNETRFVYDKKHNLADIIDPRGISVARNIYDDKGRLIAHIDAEGNRIDYTHDIAGNQEIVTDRNGNITVYTYDDWGNVTVQQDALGQITAYEYDGRHNQTVTTVYVKPGATIGDPTEPKIVTEQHYDDRDRLEWSEDQYGNRTHYYYDNKNRLERTVDCIGNETVNVYDDKGNLEKTTMYPHDGSRPRVTTYGYDSSGNQLWSKDLDEATTTYRYNSDGRMFRHENAIGAVTTYEYNAMGNRISEKRPDRDGQPSLEYNYDYDLNGKLTRYEGPGGNFSETVYNEIGKPKEVITPSGHTLYEYDYRGNLIKTTYADGSSQQTEYDAAGRSVKSWDRDGNMVQNVYDKAGRITRSLPPMVKGQEGTYTETRYDGAGRVMSRFDERRNQTRYYYSQTGDGQQRRIVTNAVGVSAISSHDESGRLVRTEHAILNHDLTIAEVFDAIRYEYDGYGQQTKTIFIDSNGVESVVSTEYDHAGRKIAEIDQAGKRTGFDYDEAGRLISVTDHMGHATYYEYDKNGNRTRQIDAEKRATVMEYNDLGQLVKRYMPCQLESIDDECQADLYETFDYNIQGSMISHTDYNGEITYYEYDSNNRLIARTLPYSIFGVTASADGMYANCMFKITGQPESGGNYNCEITCTHQSTTVAAIQIVTEGGAVAYQLPDTTSGVVNTWSIAAGDLEGIVAGQYNFELVDPAIVGGKMSANIIGISPAIEYYQTPTGVRTQTGQTTYEHDPRGRLIKEIKPTGQVIRYEYDRASNRTRVAIYPDEDSDAASSNTTYTYDELNRITEVNDITTAGIQTTSYTYDDVGNLETVTYPNGPGGMDTWSTKYTYDGLHRLISVKHRYAADGGGVDIEEFAYTLGPAGNRTKVEEYRYTEGSQPGAPDRIVDYRYDDLYRLTKEIVTTVAEGWKRTDTYTYDKVGNRLNLLRQTPEAQTEIVYEYNQADQLIEETQTTLRADGGTYAAKPRPGKSAGITLAVLAAATLTFALTPFALLRTNAKGRRARRNRRFIAAVSAFFVPLMAINPTTVYALQNESLSYQALVTAGVANIDPNTTVAEYTYDSKGNTIAKLVNAAGVETITEYTYDAENRLITVDNGNGAINLTTYTYDDEGIRTSKRVGNNLTTYITDKNRPYAQVLEEINESGEVIKRYVYGHDLISQTNSPTKPEETKRYFHYDGQMSTRALSEGTPNAAWLGCKIGKITYDAFGVVQDRQGSINVDVVTDYLYTGEQYDTNAGFYYLRTRYYYPNIGRYIAQDTYQGAQYDPVSFHKYLYAHADPLNWIDPSGFVSVSNNAGWISGLVRGILAHWLIQSCYYEQRGNGRAWNTLFGVSIAGGSSKGNGNFGFADILDIKHTPPEIYEIKPNNDAAIALGVAQLAGYIAAIKGNNRNAPLRGVTPGTTWPDFGAHVLPWPFGGMIIFERIPGFPGIIGYSIWGDMGYEYDWQDLRKRKEAPVYNHKPIAIPEPAWRPSPALPNLVPYIARGLARTVPIAAPAFALSLGAAVYTRAMLSSRTFGI